MVRPGIFWGSDECHCLWIVRVAYVDDRISVAEHVTDKCVASVQDNLHAIGPSALIAARNKANVLGRRCRTHLLTGHQIEAARPGRRDAEPGPVLADFRAR
jgi:hypothetical protein